MAEAPGMARYLVSKGLQRLSQADPTDTLALPARSRARYTSHARLPPSFPSQRLLAIRAAPPELVQPVPGPKTTVS